MRGFQEASALAGPLGSWRLLARLRPMLGSPWRSGPLLHRPPQHPWPLGRVAAACLLLLAQPAPQGRVDPAVSEAQSKQGSNAR